jgi:phage terminase small subunit
MSADRLTPKQSAFVKAYCRLGGMNGTQAAIAAGYSGKGQGAGAAVSSSRLLRLPHILTAIRQETERSLRSGVALGAQVLYELAQGAQSESVRLQAAQALLERGGMHLASLSEHQVVVEDRRASGPPPAEGMDPGGRHRADQPRAQKSHGTSR